MVIVKIKYGLGNQMLQYAVGKRLAKERNQKLYLEDFWYKDYKIDPKIKIRSYQLNKLNINTPYISRIQQYKYLIPSRNIFERNLKKLAKALKFHPAPGYLIENEPKKFQFENILIDNNFENIFLNGVWANKLYFEPVLKELRENDFTFILPIDPINKEFIRNISLRNSVSVHIRKGDYLSGRFTSYLGSICSPDYYESAFSIISKKLNNPFFFIFSDDFEWVNKNISLPKQHSIVDCNDAVTAYKDLQLMSHCKHNIIANSTFSYWGALLGKNQDDKIVIAPQKWHSGDNGEVNLYMNNWIRI